MARLETCAYGLFALSCAQSVVVVHAYTNSKMRATPNGVYAYTEFLNF